MLELEKQYQFYLDHEADFLRKYEGKFLVITDDLEVSAFESKKDAYAFGAENVGLGNFLIQECTYNAAHMVNYVNFNLASRGGRSSNAIGRHFGWHGCDFGMRFPLFYCRR